MGSEMCIRDRFMFKTPILPSNLPSQVGESGVRLKEIASYSSISIESIRLQPFSSVASTTKVSGVRLVCMALDAPLLQLKV